MLEKVTLIGTKVRLEPLSLHHLDDLAATTQDPETWLYHGCGNLTARSALESYIASVQEEPERETGLPFVIVRQEDGRVVGSSCLFDISLTHRRGEIGRTWLAPEARRTSVNTEAKLLMFQHAFETLQLLRVQIKTDTRNAVSIRAIERLGAKYEGVLRSHMVLHDGYRRDTIYFSVLVEEWAEVKERLQGKLGG